MRAGPALSAATGCPRSQASVAQAGAAQVTAAAAAAIATARATTPAGQQIQQAESHGHVCRLVRYARWVPDVRRQARPGFGIEERHPQRLETLAEAREAALGEYGVARHAVEVVAKAVETLRGERRIPAAPAGEFLKVKVQGAFFPAHLAAHQTEHAPEDVG